MSILSTCQLHINSGCGKREAHTNRSMVKPEKAAPVTGTTLRTTGPVPAQSRYICLHVCMVITYSKSKDEPGKVANPARGQLNRKIYTRYIFPCPRSRLRIWSRETGSAVPYRVSQLVSILRINISCERHRHANSGLGRGRYGVMAV